MTDEQFAWWLVGLTDGEGHFGVVRSRRRSGSGFNYRCHFRITLVESDRATLDHAHERTGWGKLYVYPRYPLGGPYQDMAIWTVNAKAGLMEVVEFFDAHPLQSQKAAEFAIWRAAARAHVERRRWGHVEDGQAQATLDAAFDQLKVMRADRKPKRRAA